MKSFSLGQALKDGFLFLSSKGRKCSTLWILFLVVLGSQIFTQWYVWQKMSTYTSMMMNMDAYMDMSPLMGMNQILGSIFTWDYFLVVFGLSIVIGYFSNMIQKAAILSQRFTEEPEISPDFFHLPFPVYLNVLWVGILLSLMIFGGFFLFIIPGIIWAVTYAYASFFILEKEKGTKYAFSMSRRLLNGVRWRFFFSFILVTVLISMVSGIFSSIFTSFGGISSMYSNPDFMNMMMDNPSSTTLLDMVSPSVLWIQIFVTAVVSTFSSFFMFFFLASIYRQLIECFKANPSLDPVFVNNYFMVRYEDEQEEDVEFDVTYENETEPIEEEDGYTD